jgi:hypothetical protein
MKLLKNSIKNNNKKNKIILFKVKNNRIIKININNQIEINKEIIGKIKLKK